jgi:putative PIN family toxin of toxin-antitoxin system
VRLVLDTNILIAAFISRGTCAELLEYCILRHELVISKFILEEFRRNLTSKFGIPQPDVSAALKLLTSRMKIVKPLDLGESVCKDPQDDPILGTALAGRCQCLITGDQDLLALHRFKDIDIIQPHAFWRYEAQSGHEV